VAHDAVPFAEATTLEQVSPPTYGALGGTCDPGQSYRAMSDTDSTIAPELRELLTMEVADIIATANEQGFATKDVLIGLRAVVSVSMVALGDDPYPAEDPKEFP
jgi:hypothetical protein